MSLPPWDLVAAEIVVLRRHRSTMLTAFVLAIGVTVLYFAFTYARHDGSFAGDRSLANGTALLGIYFGSFASILIGTEAGCADLASGVFRDLAATGRPRSALYLARWAAGVVVALGFAVCGFLIALVAAFELRGHQAAPSLGLTAQSLAWVLLATLVVTSLAVGLASVTGSRSVTLTAVLGWQTLGTTLLFSLGSLGVLRDGLLLVALGALRPGIPYGTAAHPGSSIALPAPVLPMPGGLAICILCAWAVVPVLAGLWRSATQDA